MKFNILALAGITALLLASSCSMDIPPVGSLLEDDALESVADCANFRNGFYNNLRTVSSGAYIAYSELQMDQFVGTTINGNREGSLNNGDIQSSDSDIAAFWSGYFSVIANTNYFIEHVEDLLAENTYDTDDEEAMKRYRAEAYFTRGYFYYRLLEAFCPVYNTANNAYGLPLVAKYAPTSIKTNYPSRSTQAETYAFIESDMQTAYDGLKEWENYAVNYDPYEYQYAVGSNSIYLSSYAVRALQARVALLKGDYSTAKSYAEELIECGLYNLCTTSNYSQMWTADEGSEVIFVPYADTSEVSFGSTGSYWIGASTTQADYLPVPEACTPGTAYLYERLDIRYRTFTNQAYDLLVEGQYYTCPVFTKFPGNTSLRTVSSTNNLMNRPKVFRNSEMYLIAMESAYMLGNESDANTYLDALRKNRINNYSSTSYSGTDLRDEIRKERLRELIGEGFRMADLRRWEIGFTRNDNYTTYSQAPLVVRPSAVAVVYQSDDYRYTWPIPASEIQVNPNMAGQQNPGY